MANRKELLSTIDQQRQQIQNYELKIKDVVRAYKGLLKEKEALQSTITALTVPKPTDEKEKSDASKSTSSPDSNEDKDSTHDDEGKKEKGETATSNDEVLQKQITALTNAISTINAEKSRIETSFQNDKKRLLVEKEKLEQKLSEESSSRKNHEVEYEAKIREMKSKIIVLQHDRDQETNNFTAMLREVESRLSVERTAKEKAEHLLEEMNEQNKKLTNALKDPSQDQYQKQLMNLQNELQQAKNTIKKLEKEREEPPILKKLRHEMEEMSSQHINTLHEEQIRSMQAERSAREFNHVHEDQIAKLEAKLAELSSSVAQYDRTYRFQQETIQSLKSKISELSYDNSILKTRKYSSSDSSVDNETNVDELIEKIKRLWDKLHLLSVSSEQVLEIEGLFPNRDVLHYKCRQDYDSIKSEFENFKLQAESELASDRKCTCGLSSQVEELRGKVKSLTTAMQLTHETHSDQVNQLKKEIHEVKSKSQEKLQETEKKHKCVVTRLEQMISEHREKSIETFRERDEEIIRLTREVHEMSKLPVQSGTVVASLLSQIGAAGSDGPLLHHFEESARKDMEISYLRREKRQLEKSMRDIQVVSVTKMESQQDKIDYLQNEVERFQRNNSRTGENLEYLKNVVLQYMISSDGNCRSLMLNAIAAVLKFTEKEIEDVKKYNALWWWQQGNNKNKANMKIQFNNSNE